MGKVLNILTGPLTLIDKDLGNAVRTIALTAIGNAILPGVGAFIGSALGTGLAAIGGLSSKSQRPQAAEQSIKTPIPARVDAYGASRLYPAIVLYETAADGTTVDVGAYKDGRADSIVQAYMNDDKITVVGTTVQTGADKRYQGGKVKAGWSLGLTTETAFAAVIAKLPSIWTEDHRGDGVVSAYLLKAQEKDKYFLETYPQGDSVSLSLVGKWSLVYDPRDDDQDPYDPDTWLWSDNAALAFIHYKMVRRGYDWDTRFAPQLTKLLAAIEVCDEDVALDAGGTEKRYRTAVQYNLTDTPASIEAALLACFDGWYCLNERGEVVLYAGALYEPTVSIGPDETVSYRHQAFVEDENTINEVSIQYISDVHDYSQVDAQPWRDEDDISFRGKVNTTPLDAQIPSFTQGRRLAKRSMARTNAPDRGTHTTTFGGRDVIGERYINLAIVEAGTTFFDGVAEIVGTPERDPASGGYTFDWIKADPNVDAWNPATEDGEGAPVGARVALEPLEAPTVTAVTPTYGQNTAFNTPGVKLTIEADGPDLPNLTWYVRTRPTGGVSWLEQEYSDLDPGASVTLETGFLPLGELDVEVSYRSTDGRLSPWASLDDDPIDTGGVLPGALTGLGLSVNDDGTLIAADWDDTPFASRYLVEVIVT